MRGSHGQFLHQALRAGAERREIGDALAAHVLGPRHDRLLAMLAPVADGVAQGPAGHAARAADLLHASLVADLVLMRRKLADGEPAALVAVVLGGIGTDGGVPPPIRAAARRPDRSRLSGIVRRGLWSPGQRPMGSYDRPSPWGPVHRQEAHVFVSELDHAERVLAVVEDFETRSGMSAADFEERYDAGEFDGVTWALAWHSVMLGGAPLEALAH